MSKRFWSTTLIKNWIKPRESKPKQTEEVINKFDHKHTCNVNSVIKSRKLQHQPKSNSKFLTLIKNLKWSNNLWSRAMFNDQEEEGDWFSINRFKRSLIMMIKMKMMIKEEDEDNRSWVVRKWKYDYVSCNYELLRKSGVEMTDLISPTLAHSQ